MPGKKTKLVSFPAVASIPKELRTLLQQGRWLLVAAETVVSLFVLVQGPSLAVRLALLAFSFYNMGSLVALRRTTLPRFQVPLMLGLDLFFVLLMARLTGGVQSPFIGLCYLIILAAALWYDLMGGIIIGIAASAVAVAIGAIGAIGTVPAPFVPFFSRQVQVLSTLIPSFLLTGGFTGFLVRHLKASYERDTTVRLHEQAIAQEMRLARQVQEAALPTKPPVVPGLECAFLSKAAGEVGGDFLLFLTPHPERQPFPASSPVPCLNIVLGDVSGKGISAALAATGIAHLLPWLRPLDNPECALQVLNEDLNERLPGDFYATLLFARIGSNSIRSWTAGHPPALLWRAAEKCVVSAQHMADPPLGLFPDWVAHPEDILWARGDVLLLYTDGANETRNQIGKQFTAEGLSAVLSQHVDASATDIVEAVFRAITDWGPPTDDLTLVVCKRV